MRGLFSRSRPGSAPRFLVAGSYGHGNAGDEAILRAIVEGLRRRFRGAAICAVAGDEEGVRRRLGIETVSWIDWPAIRREVGRADLVLVGGGGIFFDTAGLEEEKLLTDGARDLTHYLGVPLLCALTGRKWMVFACGAGPLRTPRAREVVRSILGTAAAVTVRDAGSADELAGLGIPRERLRVTADPVFASRLDDAAAARIAERLLGHGIPPETRCVAAAPRDLKRGEADAGWEALLARALRAHAGRTGAAVLLIPFQRGWDEPVARRVRDMLAGVPCVVLEGADDLEIAAAIERSAAVVAMRLHSLVFALREGVPAVALAYDLKVARLAGRSGFGRYCVPMDRADLLDERLAEIERSPGLARKARRQARRLRRSAEESFEIAERILRSGPPPTSADATLAAIAAAVDGRMRALDPAGSVP